MAAEIFSFLKKRGHDAEYVNEYAKELVWKRSSKMLLNQLYIFAKQENKMWILKEENDVITTDSPLILQLYYGKEEPQCHIDYVLYKNNLYDNINIWLNRAHAYNPVGRNQTEEDAIKIDEELRELLRKNNIPIHLEVPATIEGTSMLMQYLTDECGL